MTTRCHEAVRAATGDVFDKEAIDDFLNRLASRAKRKKTDLSLDDRAAIRQAAEELTRDELRAALEARRVQLAADTAREARRARIDAMPKSMDEAQRLSAYDLGSERQGLGTSSSVDAEGRARAADLWSQVEIGLKQMPGLLNRISNGFLVGERGFDRLVAREMARLQGAPGVEPTGDEGALHAARVLVAAMEKGRLMQNDQGAWIEHLPGYVARQKHDAVRMAGGMWKELAEIHRRAKAGDWRGALNVQDAATAAERKAFEAWRDFIKPKLDPRTFDGLDPEDVDPNGWITAADDAEFAKWRGQKARAEKAAASPWTAALSVEDRMLYQVWFNVVSGAREAAAGADDLADWRPPASKARSVSKARTLHFTDSDAWLDYNDRYGRGSLFSSVMAQLERAGRNTALMQRWGPSPEAARAAEIARLQAEARARGPEGAKVARRLSGKRQQADFDVLTGAVNAPENLKLATFMRAVRMEESLGKLGSMVLSKTTDLPMAGHTMARAGASFLKGYEGAVKGISRLGGEDAKHAAEMLGASSRAFSGNIAGRFHGADGPLGWMSWASRLHYKVNTFDFVNDGVKEGIAAAYARHLGLESPKGYDGLNAGTRETFERFGITPTDWEAARHGLLKDDQGRSWFTFDHLADPELKLKFQTMIHNVIDDAVSEPRGREARVTTGGYRPGTLLGEFHRAFGQFKGFTFAILGRHLTPAARGYAGYAPAALLAHMVVAGTLAGYLSLQMKMIVAGKEPRAILNEKGEIDGRLWAAALTAGAGLGIYGDFLLGEETRNGGKFSLDAFGGPVISDAEQLATVVRSSFQANTFGQDAQGDQVNKHLPGELVRLASQHIPLINTYYTRLALDYLVLWRLQEASSPGYLRRYQEHVEQAQHTHFLVSPADAIGG